MEVNLRPPNAVDETPPALRGVVAPPVSVPSMNRGIRTGTQFVAPVYTLGCSSNPPELPRNNQTHVPTQVTLPYLR